jgi:uncharacterized heparinase superfamily protein
VIIEASHDGYRRLPGTNKHRRRWILDERALRIEDEISGTFATAAAHFHIHPDVEARLHGMSEVLLACAGQTRRMVFEGASSIELRSGAWHPQFGVTVPNRFIVASFAAAQLTTSIFWTPA